MRSGHDPSSTGDVTRGRGRLRSLFRTFGYRGCLAAAIACMLILTFPVRAKADTIIVILSDLVEQIENLFNVDNQSDDQGSGNIAQAQSAVAQTNNGLPQDASAKGAVVTSPPKNITSLGDLVVT